MKCYTLSNELGHMTNMAAMPIYNKNFKKKILLQSQSTNGLETSYVASGTPYDQDVQIMSLGRS